jgi:hypothetical protein
MKSYSASGEIFTKEEMKLIDYTNKIVKVIPNTINGELVRCHEVARIVASILDLWVADGFYGFVDHSWCWVKEPPKEFIGMSNMPHILDPYCIGSLPQVRLLAGGSTSLPHTGTSYRMGPYRTDINQKFVDKIVNRIIKLGIGPW